METSTVGFAVGHPGRSIAINWAVCEAIKLLAIDLGSTTVGAFVGGPGTGSNACEEELEAAPGPGVKLGCKGLKAGASGIGCGTGWMIQSCPHGSG